MKVIQKIIKIIGIIFAVLIVIIAIRAIYNQVAIKTEADRIIPNGQMVDLGDYSVHVYAEGDSNLTPTLVFMSGSATVAPVYDFNAIYSLLTDEYRIAVVVNIRRS